MASNILVVDDDELIQSFCKTVLDGAGFRVEACGTVKEALQSARSDPPDLLDISQADQAHLGPQFDAVEVKLLMGKMKELFAAIVVNLISNALGIAPKGAAVDLECVRKGAAAPSGSGARHAVGDGASQGAAARFIVSDREPGVPDREKSGIFEKYHGAKGGGNLFEQGRGIGLTFCRLAAEVLKGRIWVEDREGGGSRFIFENPGH